MIDPAIARASLGRGKPATAGWRITDARVWTAVVGSYRQAGSHTEAPTRK